MTIKSIGLAARALIRNQDRWLLMRRSQFTRHFAGEWEMPGGKLENGERLDQALIRETHEETAIEVQPGRLAGVCEYELPEIRTVQIFFEAAGNTDAVRISDEHDLFMWIATAEICGQPLTAQVRSFLTEFCRVPTALHDANPPEANPLPMQISAKALVRSPDNRILLVQRTSMSKNNAGAWEFPGGKSDPGETIDAALRREIREETGLEVQIGALLGTAESALPGRRVIYLFFEAESVATEVRLSEEHDRFVWLSLRELPTQNLSPQFRPFVKAIVQNSGRPVLIAC